MIIYVDKSGLIGLINQTIDSAKRMTCVSRPRRFGKIICGPNVVVPIMTRRAPGKGFLNGLEIADRCTRFRDYLQI